MIKITEKQQKLLLFFLQKGFLSSSQVHDDLIKLGEKISLVTIKRELSKMSVNGKETCRKGLCFVCAYTPA